MNRFTMSKILGALLAIVIIAICTAQQPKQKYTKSDDLRTMQAKDQDIWNWLGRLNMQIQADTLKMPAQAYDTVYLSKKYADATFKVIGCYRKWGGGIEQTLNFQPISDSSFQISKTTSDTSVIQWMSIK